MSFTVEEGQKEATLNGRRGNVTLICEGPKGNNDMVAADTRTAVEGRTKVAKKVTRHRSGGLVGQEQRDKVASFMESLDGSTEEEDWEDESESWISEEVSSFSEEDMGLSNLIFNSQVSLSFDSHNDPDYTAPSNHSVCHRLLSSEQSVESSNAPLFVPCSVTIADRVGESSSPDQSNGENSMSFRTINEEKASHPRGEASTVRVENKVESRSENVKEYTAEDMMQTLEILGLSRRGIGSKRQGRGLYYQKRKGAGGAVTRRGFPASS